MERAATQCVKWLMDHYPGAASFAVFCGKGNNGGDGLAIARQLIQRGYPVDIYMLEFGHKGTDDFQTNLARLHQLNITSIHFIQTENNFHPLAPGTLIIDALFGSGLNRQLESVTANLVGYLNNSGNEIIAIDLPGGLFADRSSKGNPVIHATHTLSFQCYKTAFLVAENQKAIGNVHILDIGLSHEFYQSVANRFEWLDESIIQSIYKPRKRFSHKGSYGHALLIAGSYGKIGAAVLSAKACLRSGVGLLTVHIPGCGYSIMQSVVPEAMVMTDFNSSFNTRVEDDLSKYEAIGVGPGSGIASETKMLLREVFDAFRLPMVIDADALNILASQKDLLRLVPGGSVLTPHPKEFERLFGEQTNDFDRIEMALQKAAELQCIIVLKGHHTFIATPDGKGFFNTTGNAGMATAGSGDVLTGILTGLLAQGYSSIESAIAGVYLHGMAGDMAATDISMEAVVAGDIISYMGKAFLQLKAEK